MPAHLSVTWNLLSSNNFEGYMLALGIDFPTHKRVKLLKPQKVVEQNGDSIHTYSSVRNPFVKFRVGEEFAEDNKGLDNRRGKSLVTWDNDKLTCAQKRKKRNRGWTHWIDGNKLHPEMFCEGQVCKETFQRGYFILWISITVGAIFFFILKEFV